MKESSPAGGSCSLPGMRGLGGFPALDLEHLETSTLQNSRSLYKRVCSHPRLEPAQVGDGPNLPLGLTCPQREELIRENALVLFIPLFEESDRLAVDNVSLSSAAQIQCQE